MKIVFWRKVAAMVCAAGVLALAAACGGSGGGAEETAFPTVSPRESAAAAELRALVARADTATFQATYDATIDGV